MAVIFSESEGNHTNNKLKLKSLNYASYAKGALKKGGGLLLSKTKFITKQKYRE